MEEKLMRKISIGNGSRFVVGITLIAIIATGVSFIWPDQIRASWEDNDCEGVYENWLELLAAVGEAYQAYEEAKTKANEIETQVIQLEEEKNNAWDESNTAYTDWQVCADTLWGVAQQRICGPKWAKAMELKKKYKDKNAEYLEAKKNT